METDIFELNAWNALYEQVFDHVVILPAPSMMVQLEIIFWCKSNIGLDGTNYQWIRNDNLLEYRFRKPQDATFFALKWL